MKIRNPNYTPKADAVKQREAALKTFIEPDRDRPRAALGSVRVRRTSYRRECGAHARRRDGGIVRRSERLPR